MCIGVGANLWLTHTILSAAYQPYGAGSLILEDDEEIGRDNYHLVFKHFAVSAVLVGLFAILIGNLLHFEPIVYWNMDSLPTSLLLHASRAGVGLLALGMSSYGLTVLAAGVLPQWCGLVLVVAGPLGVWTSSNSPPRLSIWPISVAWSLVGLGIIRKRLIPRVHAPRRIIVYSWGLLIAVVVYSAFSIADIPRATNVVDNPIVSMAPVKPMTDGLIIDSRPHLEIWAINERSLRARLTSR
jgi:hypothetical protein